MRSITVRNLATLFYDGPGGFRKCCKSEKSLKHYSRLQESLKSFQEHKRVSNRWLEEIEEIEEIEKIKEIEMIEKIEEIKRIEEIE